MLRYARNSICFQFYFDCIKLKIERQFSRCSFKWYYLPPDKQMLSRAVQKYLRLELDRNLY